jgi:hypothetical protein
VEPRWRDAVPDPHALPTLLHRCADFVVVSKPYGWAASADAAWAPGSIAQPPVLAAWLAATLGSLGSAVEFDDPVAAYDVGLEGVPCLDADCSGAVCFATSPSGQVGSFTSAPQQTALISDTANQQTHFRARSVSSAVQAALAAGGCTAQFVAMCDAAPSAQQLPPGASVALVGAKPQQ